MSSSLSIISMDLTPSKPEACCDLTHQNWFCQFVRQSGLFSGIIEMVLPKEQWFLF
jgi:hypothetical protein